jgi:cardiolipin synthase
MKMDWEFRLERRKGKSTLLAMPLFVAIGLLAAIALLATVLWSVKRRVDTRLTSVQQKGQLTDLIPSIVGLTHGQIAEGTRVRVLQNGALFPDLLAAMREARETIHFETYVWWKGEICREVATVLSQKARQGVEVRLLVDASGASRMENDLAEMMRDAGVHVRRFHPFRLANLGRVNNRDHRKIVIIDGRIGYVGGHGIADEWTGNAQDKHHWRDTFLRLEGPVVSQLQAAFSENWIEETGEIIAGERYFPRLAPAGNSRTHVAYSSPTGGIASVQLLYYLAITAARTELLIQNPYFLPDRDGIEALAEAVARGVDVRVMMPSDDATDTPLVQHASHHHFGTLLKRGVRIYEYQPTLLHQKVMIVDGLWSTVGSTNFDDRSFELNDEISIGIIDPEIAAQLKAAFDEDMRHSAERTYQEWSNRSLWHKFVDGITYLANEQL